MKRIMAAYPGLYEGYKELLDIIQGKKFIQDDYICDKALTGEYLLGYHSQRWWLKTHKRHKGQWIEKSIDQDNSSNTLLANNQ
jgi:CRISPR-associated protein Csd1